MRVSSAGRVVRFLPRAMYEHRPGPILGAIVLVAFAIRLYLSLTNFCISGDGAAYLGMARDFASGATAHALASVFSPLYPLLIAGAQRLVPDWELAGSLVSAVLGTGAVATVFVMTREAFGRDDYALGAAALTAIHPELAAYSASVRTEAGFIFLMTAAVAALLAGLERRRLWMLAAAGLAGGLAYLYRTEAIGLLIFATAFVPIAAMVWKRWTAGWALVAAGCFGAVFLLVAAPYLIFLRESTGHWSIGREFNAAMMYGLGEVAPNARHWQELGYSPDASPLEAIMKHPALYARKVGLDFGATLYGFVQALGIPATLLLAMGIWSRRRQLGERYSEALPAGLTAFYLVGFSFSYTGARFMVHLIPFTFGWVMAGLEELAALLAEHPGKGRARAITAPAAPAVALALVLLPRTLWPIGYDMRGVRYAGREIARRSNGRATAVIASDGRFAFYANAALVLLPEARVPDFCGWVRTHREADYLAAGHREEQRLGISVATPCLALIRRYPRYGSGYYDLFAVRHSN